MWCSIRDALIQKINNQPVECKMETIDRYKRIVAECFVNNESLSQYLVRNDMLLHIGDILQNLLKMKNTLRLINWIMVYAI